MVTARTVAAVERPSVGSLDGVDPIEALERVVYLQDRGLVSSRKTAAFVRAAEVLRSLPPSELEGRLADGTLTALPGIGPSTAEVAVQAAAGEVPRRILELEASTEVPVGEGGGLRTAVRGDCHTHSTWSDGGAPIDAMVATARALGHEYLVVTDHSARLTVAHGLDRDRLLAQLDEIERLNDELDDFRILTGMEVDILLDGTLDLDDDLLSRLDLVVASVHSKLSMPAGPMTDRMLRAVASPHVDVLGHCTGRKVHGFGPDQEVVRPPSDFDADLVFAACARFDTAVEINCRPERQDPPPELLDLALEWECRISIDTDAHAPGQLEFLAYGCDKAARHGIPPERIVNTRTADELVAWTTDHAG
jgi:putative hydrolase